MKVVPDQLAPWLPGRLETLGTDGFGRSDNREYLRRHFEINAESIVAAALSRLARDGKFDAAKADAAFAELGVDTREDRPDAGVTLFTGIAPRPVMGAKLVPSVSTAVCRASGEVIRLRRGHEPSGRPAEDSSSADPVGGIHGASPYWLCEGCCT